MRGHKIIAVALVLASALVTVPPIQSQSRQIETVRGEVRKQRSDGRLIPGALVTITLTSSNQAVGRSVTTGWDGFYFFQDIPPGTYTLVVSEKEKRLQNFRVDLRQVPTTDIPLIVLPAKLKDHRTAYANAIRAIDLEDWSGAVYILRQLLTLHPEDARSRQELIQTLGNYRDLYRPHFYLGFALQKLGDCEGALQEWGKEESLGKPAAPHQIEIQKGRKACRQAEERRRS